jgi:PadR family transcriptional regulator PadR
MSTYEHVEPRFRGLGGDVGNAMTKAPVKLDLLQGTLDMLILRLCAAGPMHGYALAQRLLLLSRDALKVPQGSLYPALHRLEGRGWLKAEWKQTETGREAKFYSLTRLGRKQLASEHEGWQRLATAIDLVMSST